MISSTRLIDTFSSLSSFNNRNRLFYFQQEPVLLMARAYSEKTLEIVET